MSNTIQAVQHVNEATETQQTALPPKSQQPAANTTTPQDSVTISASAKQALAANPPKSGGGQ